MILSLQRPLRGMNGPGSMGSHNPRLRNGERKILGRFLVAQTRHYLYDFSRASKRVPKQEAMSTARAIIAVALAGGVFWLLLWKFAVSLWGTR
jgi:hypothetical protein